MAPAVSDGEGRAVAGEVFRTEILRWQADEQAEWVLARAACSDDASLPLDLSGPHAAARTSRLMP